MNDSSNTTIKSCVITFYKFACHVLTLRSFERASRRPAAKVLLVYFNLKTMVEKM